jgi:CRISPR/Cas system CSM-associated protein Csm5 (group 7 of RAMP superfamily)
MNRKELDLKLSKSGYEHPTENNNNTSLYKVYNAENINTDPYSSMNYDTYSKFSSENMESTLNCCPVCNGEALYLCECDKYRDRMCKKGHTWYIKNGKAILGDPHKDE